MTATTVPGLTACHSCARGGPASREAARVAQLESYATLDAAGVARLATVGCLDQCGRGDAIVVRPAPAQGRAIPPVWLAGITTPATTAALRAWLTAGGPGRADLPDALALHVVPPPAETQTGPAGG